MNYSDYRFTLDIQLHQAQVSVPATYGDSARRLCIGLTDGRKPYVIGEGCMAVFNAKKPDGTRIQNYCIIENNTVIYEFTLNTTSCEGIVDCDITIYDINGKALTSPQFIIVVDAKVVRDDDRPISSEDESTILNGIIADEIKRQSAEDDRFREEIARADAERTRIENENIRISYEDQRQYNEEKRKNAEEVRDDAETMRGIAEDARVEAETNRGYDEGRRKLEENDRKANETARASAESGRVEAETARVEAEKRRVTQDNNRDDRENYRVEAENTRISRENDRIYNENKRISAENARAEAEIAREALIGDIDRAIDAIIAIQNSFLPTTYTFSFIDPYGIVYHIEFEEGMTWEAWCDSNYNCLGAYVEGGSVRVLYNSSYYIIIDTDTGFMVDRSEVIDINKKYGYLVW